MGWGTGSFHLFIFSHTTKLLVFAKETQSQSMKISPIFPNGVFVMNRLELQVSYTRTQEAGRRAPAHHRPAIFGERAAVFSVKAAVFSEKAASHIQ